MSAAHVFEAPPLFRFTCDHHRKFFLDIMHKHGIHSSAEMEHIRLHFVHRVAMTYPASYVKHLEEQSCMGCAFEHAGPSCQDWALDTLSAMCRGEDLPPAIFKSWTEVKSRT